MGLLGWDILRPQNNLAAVLYPAPVRVSSIRIFPTGARPFSQSPETVAYVLLLALETVFFSAHTAKVSQNLRPSSLMSCSTRLSNHQAAKILKRNEQPRMR